MSGTEVLPSDVLRLLYEEGIDYVTPTLLVYRLRIPSVQATRLLERMLDEGTVELDSDDHGNLVYRLPPADSRLATRSVRGGADAARETTQARRPGESQPDGWVFRGVVGSTRKWATTTDPKLAALLSCFIPGAGQLYNRQFVKAIAAVSLFILLWFYYLGWLIWLWAPFDAYHAAMSRRQERRLDSG